VKLWHAELVAWRCRRGLKELDIILQAFFQQHYSDMPDEQKLTLQSILLWTDPELMDALLYQHTNPDLAMPVQQLLTQLRIFAKSLIHYSAV